MTLKEQLDEIQTLIDKVNAGNAAFWTLVRDYPQVVRSKLGKDANIAEITKPNKDFQMNIRDLLGNDLEIAIGEKNP